MADTPDYGSAISNIESGGKYGLLGPVTKSGDRAYGKYQVMGANIPQWTQEILGAPMAPKDFLADPQAQDAVFQGKFGQYVQKYGPEGAAQAWFAGPGGVGKLDRKDQLGTSVGDYGQRFMAGLGSQGDNAPAPISGPQIPPQAQNLQNSYQPPQQQAPQPAQPVQQPVQQQLPALGSMPSQPQTAQADAMPMAAPLNAPPPIQQIIRQMNMRQAFSKIPVPQGFKGFSYS